MKVFLTAQVMDEFRRNREVKIADAYKRFEKSTVNESFPQVAWNTSRSTIGCDKPPNNTRRPRRRSWKD